MNNFLQILKEKNHILADGATGTNLFAMGLETGDPPEPWNINHRDRIRALHQGFVDAGSDMFLTNSFGGTSYRLKLHKFEDRVFELNKAAGIIAREVADNSDRLVIVAGAMGPTGEMIEPHGLMTPGEATDAFKAQAEGLVEGGVDVLWLETMYSMEELEAALDAVKDFGRAYFKLPKSKFLFLFVFDEFKFEVQPLSKVFFLKNSSHDILKPRVFLGQC